MKQKLTPKIGRSLSPTKNGTFLNWYDVNKY